MCSLGMTRTWVGLRGAMSWNASDEIVVGDGSGRQLAAHDPAEQAVGLSRAVSGHGRQLRDAATPSGWGRSPDRAGPGRRHRSGPDRSRSRATASAWRRRSDRGVVRRVTRPTGRRRGASRTAPPRRFPTRLAAQRSRASAATASSSAARAFFVGLVDLARHPRSPAFPAGPSSGRRGVPAKPIARMNASDRAQAASSSVGKPTIASAWIATPGIASRTRSTTARVLRGDVAPAHPPEHAVVARLERQVEVRQGPRRPVDPDAEQLVVDVLGLDRGEPDPLDVRLVEDPPDEPGERQRRPPVGAPEPALGPAAVVGPDVDPGQDDLAVAGRERSPDVAEHDLRGQATAPARGRPG